MSRQLLVCVEMSQLIEGSVIKDNSATAWRCGDIWSAPGSSHIHDGQNNATINIAVSHQSKRNYNNHNQSTQRMTAVKWDVLLLSDYNQWRFCFQNKACELMVNGGPQIQGKNSFLPKN